MVLLQRNSSLQPGKSSRLYQRMVSQLQIVTDVSTYNEPRLDPGAFWFTFELCEDVEFAEVEECLQEEIQKVQEGGLDEDEIRRARTQLESAFLFEEETALDSAMKIGRWGNSDLGSQSGENSSLVIDITGKMILS